jgi:hypothetical protein
MSAIEPFYNEQEIPVGDEVLRLVIDFRMIDLLEGLLGRKMDELIREVCDPEPPHALTVKFVWAMLRRHHSEVTLDQVATLMYGDNRDVISFAAGALVKRAFNLFEGSKEGEQSSRPPKRSSGASRSSARSGSPRASRPTPSGRKRPARS